MTIRYRRRREDEYTTHYLVESRVSRKGPRLANDWTRKEVGSSDFWSVKSRRYGDWTVKRVGDVVHGSSKPDRKIWDQRHDKPNPKMLKTTTKLVSRRLGIWLGLSSKTGSRIGFSRHRPTPSHVPFFSDNQFVVHRFSSPPPSLLFSISFPPSLPTIHHTRSFSRSHMHSFLLHRKFWCI